MSRKVTVALMPDGQVGINFSGFVGNDCLIEAQKIEQSLRDLGVELKIEAREMHAGTEAPPAIPEVTPTRAQPALRSGRRRS